VIASILPTARDGGTNAALEIPREGSARSFDSTGPELGRGSTSTKERLRAAERAHVHELSHRRAHVGIRGVAAIAWLAMARS
jgi:hypothetical protein